LNSLTMHGVIARDAEKYEVETDYGKKNLVSFIVSDFGVPGNKGSTFTIEVHFMKEVAEKLLPHLVKGKEVFINGFLSCKEYVTRNGDTRFKFYYSALSVELAGKSSDKEAGEAA